MDRKTSRFLLLEAALILVVLLLSQIFPYPLSGFGAVEERLEGGTQLFKHRVVVRADLKSSILYILEIDGQYCEKMFDKSLLFDRYVEKPLVLLRRVGDSPDIQFVARDSAQNFLYAINSAEEAVILRQSQNDGLTLAYAVFGGTLILLGICFGTGRARPGKKASESTRRNAEPSA